MDPVTHGALGASLSQLCLYRWDKRNAWIVGGLAALAPDLDVIIRSAQNPMLILLYHRQFSHSLFFIPFGALLVTLALMLFKRFRNQWQLTYIAAFTGFATHGLLDAATTYGTVLYWPFSESRISWDVVSIIDPWVTIPLIAGLVWTSTFKTVKGVLASLVFVCAFLLSNTIQHSRALQALKDYATKNQIQFTKARAFPNLASSRHWRGIATTTNQLYAFNILTPVFQHTRMTKANQLPLFENNKLPEYVKNTPSLMKDLAIFTWFSDNFLFIIKENPLTIGDGRFLVDEKASIALWSIQFLPNEPHVRKYNFINPDSKILDY